MVRMIFYFEDKKQKTKLHHVIRGENKRSKAFFWQLVYIKEAANCGLRFRGFKPTNTLRWMLLKVRRSKKDTKKVLRK